MDSGVSKYDIPAFLRRAAVQCASPSSGRDSLENAAKISFDEVKEEGRDVDQAIVERVRTLLSSFSKLDQGWNERSVTDCFRSAIG